jgi:uncharacterized membrane protein HdeD (DUF308 family)
MLAFGGLVEGVYQEWCCIGWGGAVLGGLVGTVGGVLVVMLPVMPIHLIMILRGIDPFPGPDTPERTPDDQ